MLSASASLSINNEETALTKLRSIVESGLTHDWILRIEHKCGSDTHESDWQEWCEPAFAITSATQLVTDIAECHNKHPAHAIRLLAEKPYPRTQMLYCVYHATPNNAATVQTVPPPVSDMQAANDRSGFVAAGLKSLGSRTWLIAAVIGVMTSSFLVIYA